MGADLVRALADLRARHPDPARDAGDGGSLEAADFHRRGPGVPRRRPRARRRGGRLVVVARRLRTRGFGPGARLEGDDGAADRRRRRVEGVAALLDRYAASCRCRDQGAPGEGGSAWVTYLGVVTNWGGACGHADPGLALSKARVGGRALGRLRRG